MQNLAIFASGTGSNAVNLIKFFAKNEQIQVKILCCNKEDAPVVKKAAELNIDTYTFSKDDLAFGKVKDRMKDLGIDFIVLAGFLWLIPGNLVEAYPNKIINIHPSLLPKYGGKGMYGKKVHQAVALNNESETGITVHFVNMNYDEGQIIKQVSVPLNVNDGPELIEEKVRKLEQEHFPLIVEQTILGHDEV